MRARNLKPGFFKNEDLAEIEPLGRLLFQGLWCMADRDGRLEDRPKRIKVEVLPYDSVNINKLLTALHDKKFIIRYQIKGNNFIQIVNFKKHQSPHMKEQESTIPAPDLSGANLVQESEHQTSTVQAPDLHGSCPPESPFPITDSSINTLVSSKGGNGVEEEFEVWWKAYPGRRKTGKPVVLAKFKHLRKTGVLPPLNVLLATLDSQKKSLDWTKNAGDYIPGPLPYLNQGKYIDESIPNEGQDWDSYLDYLEARERARFAPTEPEDIPL